MNPRILELAGQAGYTPLPGFDFANDLQEIFLKKFALLIVGECCQYLENEAERLYGLSAKENDPDHKEVYKANFEICAEKCYDNSQMLKDRFGVEE